MTISQLVAENQVLQEKILKLERQRTWLADKLACMCMNSDCGKCGVPEPCPYSKGLLARCWDAEKEEWIQVAEESK